MRAAQVPVLLALVYVALWLHTKLKWYKEPAPTPPAITKVKAPPATQQP